MKRRIFCILLAVTMIFQMMPIIGIAGENGGEFCFVACSDKKIVIDPCYIEYDTEDTIQDALAKSAHDFAGLENGFITEIDGVSASYYTTDNFGEYNLEKPAGEISCYAFLGIDLSMVDDKGKTALCSMICKMAEYLATDNGVHSYAPAQKAYREAEDALFNEEADFGNCEEKLSEAMQQYIDEVLNAPVAELNMNFVDEEGNALKTYELTLTSEFGKEVSFDEKDIIEVAAGSYDFILSSGINSAEGSFIVDEEGNASIGGNECAEIELFTGEWVKWPTLHRDNGSLEDCYATDENGTYFIPDYIGPSGNLIYIPRGEDALSETYNGKVKAYAVYRNAANETVNLSRSWESKADSISKLIESGTKGNTFEVQARYNHPDGYLQVQTLNCTVERIPAINDIRVYSDGIKQEIGFSSDNREYSLRVLSESITVEADAFSEEASVTINGKTVKAGDSVEIDLSEQETSVLIKAAYRNGKEETYSLTAVKVEASEVTVNHARNVTVHVFNAAGSELGAKSSEKTASVYRLVPGETYTYVTDRGEFFHSTATFAAAKNLQVTAVSPEIEDALVSMRFSDDANNTYELDKEFVGNTHVYTVKIADSVTNCYLESEATKGAVEYLAETNSKLMAKRNNIKNVLVKGAEPQKMTIKVVTASGEVSFYQEYLINVEKVLTLNDISVNVDGSRVNLFKCINGETSTDYVFDRMITEYRAFVVRASDEMKLVCDPVDSDYYVTINGERQEGTEYVMNLDTALDTESITVEVGCDGMTAEQTAYQIVIEKKDAVETTFEIKNGRDELIQDAVIVAYDDKTNKRIWPDENGKFPFVDSMNYRVYVTCYGYVGQRLDITSSLDNAIQTVVMERAPEKRDYNITSSWPNFRGTDDAIGVFNMKTPTMKSKAVLSWANQLGEGYSSNAVSCPILITEDGYDYLIVYAGDYLYKVDALTGNVVNEQRMDHKSSFAINSPTFAEGMIFVGLSDGCIQAFDAKTLEPAWIYKDELKGQPNCPITYNNGYIYTGFWNSETADAHYVCLSVTDEDTANTDEVKIPTWTYSCGKGFYWAGAYVCDDYLLVGTDDGDSGYLERSSSLLCIDPEDGRLLDSYDGLRGDIRSNVSYDKDSDRFYFTSKGGYFYSVKVAIVNGTAEILDDSFREIYLNNYGNDTSKPPMSTCTPVVYKNRAYIGVSGVGQFTAYSGHNLTVLDLNNWSIAYSVPTQGYPQTSGLLTTAYEDEDGYIYVYFFDNFTPGKLRVLKDKEGLTAPASVEIETFKDKGKEIVYNTPEVLFTPSGNQEQYAICSPIGDDHGTMYFKNDSAYLMSLTNTIKSIEIITNPAKMSYAEGESFDPTGMIVRITYDNDTYYDLPASREMNGKTITYFTWDEAPLSAANPSVDITFPYVMYQNNNSGVGQPVTAPTVSLALTVEAAGEEVLLGDVNGDGKINNKDISILKKYLTGRSMLDERALLAADVTKDGKINNKDVSKMKKYLTNKIESLQ